MASWASLEGSPFPLGATWIASEQAFNFALYSDFAAGVTLLCYAAQDGTNPVFTYNFQPSINKTGPVWHARIPHSQIATAVCYAYLVSGPADGSGDSFNAYKPAKVLVDPYAKSVFVPTTFDRLAALGTQSNAGKAVLGVLPSASAPTAPAAYQPPRHSNDLVIYEVHVRGFTQNANSGVDDENRGTFDGLVDKIPYLQQLGITAVELMPVFAFDHTEPNYWGYMPLSFFAPHPVYTNGNSHSEQISSFKRMVEALHAANIEVILDVVYNHTGEGDEEGPTFNFKGIDASTYYIYSGNSNSPFADFTGTGNTFNAGNRAARQVIVDSLRYWVRVMGVDGFRFDLASVFSRNSDGSISFNDPPIFGEIAADPHLVRARLIAEPWEGNPKYPNYELGSQRNKPHFPGTGWRQWNDLFRTTVRHFVKGDPGTLADFMTRIYGSADVFPDSLLEACRPYQSLNYIASHDGYTLYDLVSYNSPDSWNCGGPDGDVGVTPAVMHLRKQQVKNFCCVLMLSNGTPMFRAGDEFLQTQQGNQNPYNIDSTLTWLDWSRLDEYRDIFRFFSKMIAFRKNHPSIARSTFWREDIHWYGVNGGVDYSFNSHALAYALLGASEADENLYLMINTFWQPLTYTIQEPGSWKRIVDTSQDSPDDFIDETDAPVLSQHTYTVQPRSVVVLTAPTPIN